MKTGLTLTELAQKIEHNALNKEDYVVDSGAMTMTNDAKLTVSGQDSFNVKAHAHGQIGDRLGIPKKYYDTLLEEYPELLAQNVNTLMPAKAGRRLVRTLDGNVRAFLSERYKIVENETIAGQIFPIISEIPGAEVVSCEITDTRMYIKVLTPKLEAEVLKNDIVQGGIVFSNSEVGAGAITVKPLIYRLVCTNGMIMEDGAYRSTHLGGKLGGDAFSEVINLEQDTVMAQAQAIALMCRDYTKSILDQNAFQKRILKMQETTQNRIEGDVPGAVEVVRKKLNLTGNESSGVLKHLIEGGDLSQWGMLNAVTRTAADMDSYDRATDLESMGNKILTLPKNEWAEIATAKPLKQAA